MALTHTMECGVEEATDVLVVVAKLRKLFERAENEIINLNKRFHFDQHYRSSAWGTDEGGLDSLNIHSANSNQKWFDFKTREFSITMMIFRDSTNESFHFPGCECVFVFSLIKINELNGVCSIVFEMTKNCGVTKPQLNSTFARAPRANLVFSISTTSHLLNNENGEDEENEISFR